MYDGPPRPSVPKHEAVGAETRAVDGFGETSDAGAATGSPPLRHLFRARDLVR